MSISGGRLEAALVDELYGNDEAWIRDGVLIGMPDEETSPSPDRGLSGQRALH